ncbi:hypothetical protein DICPUDRAFT_74467 [Dictyostelium purpureum]|uniref:Sugar phosphate transporter domain-containing protein n=1 Tax=Dictyostelium purpureum TaxID=5786 RepID=F0Z7U2_DICPU|nr:uncharacterized protein DICPUDRAFT_74467 [Dictyostelium purpureum]EGC39968.1 hypothetical protein DICPUDRAFT_74467 [Dictyostelium purpureum]|eukprot:XP_003283471.1 hypothetical protein DICPUDRAFT_74467 [Dictyostelium purpureum]
MIFDVFTSILPMSMIMLGCCSNVVTLELIIKESSSHAVLVTFFQFLTVAIIAFFVNVIWKVKYGIIPIPIGFRERKIPMTTYFLMVSIFFILSVLNNKALDYDIPVPFHMIFRSSSLLSTIFIGSIFYKKSYSKQQVISLFMVTLGIIFATFNSMPDSKKDISFGQESNVFKFSIGILMLTTAMFLSSILGLIQESTYRLYGKDRHYETIFYSHLLSLPFFLFLKDDIIQHILINNQSQLLELPFGLGEYPSLWVYLIINVITQYVCIQGVFILTGKTSTLTCTLVISIRKFISIIISVIYFKNDLTFLLFISTCLVFIGTFMYSTAPKIEKKSPTPVQLPKNTKKDKIKTK